MKYNMDNMKQIIFNQVRLIIYYYNPFLSLSVGRVYPPCL